MVNHGIHSDLMDAIHCYPVGSEGLNSDLLLIYQMLIIPGSFEASSHPSVDSNRFLPWLSEKPPSQRDLEEVLKFI